MLAISTSEAGGRSQYYSLADEEVDFITNFEIKYQMGGDAEEEDEAEGAAAAN